MKKTKQRLWMPLLLLGAFIFAAAISPAHAGEGKANWLTDFEAAKEQAKAGKKPMLLDFTGSDWCIWCIRLKKEVFSRDAFIDFASDRLVLVKVDFPRKTELPASLQAQNQALAETYGIRGFPTIVLLSPEGELIGRTGYRRGGVEPYLAHLKELLGEG